MFDGWAGVVAPTLAPSGDGVHLALEIRRQDLATEPELLRIDDPVSGVVHRCRTDATTVRADLHLAAGERVELAAGALPDGRPVVLEVVAHTR